jgi:DNA N-6-adenine-methyltransferase (Dam)
MRALLCVEISARSVLMIVSANLIVGTGQGFGFEQPMEGQTNDWLTPPALLNRLGRFDLDPCACPGMPWRTADTMYFLPENDGLLDPWFGRVWCNPPYGPHVGKWARKMAEHGNGILLIFSRVETKAWQEVWKGGDAFLFPFGRINFLRPNGERAKSGTAPSALVAYGEQNVEALRNCDVEGAFFGRAEMLGGIKGSKL